jgi:molybdate transport system ATP-binding protein
MDEPLAALDNARKQEILPYLERLHTSFDIPILYVSHSMDEVARLADHVVVLHEGKVSAQGSLTEVFSRMDSPVQFTQESGVILQGHIVEKDARWHLMQVSFSGGTLWLHDSGEAIDEPVRIRVLARDLSLALNNHDDTSILNRLEVEVLEIAPGPNKAMAMVRLKAGDDYLIARVTHRSVDHLNIQVGKKLLAQIKSVAIVS